MKQKRKTSVTLDKEVLEWIAEQIKTRRFRSISHAIEFAVYELMQKERKK
jgi:Arc/MetJ-type ribon-helix-helix transcriptional regulator